MSTKILELPKNNRDRLSAQEKKDIANEVFLAEKFCRLRYIYNWEKKEKLKEKGLRSKDGLLHWLDGRNEDAVDFATIYCEENNDHFDEEGNWQGRYLFKALNAISRKFLDPEYITNDEKLRGFEISARNEQWRKNAVLVIGDYFARSLHDISALKSNYLSEKVAIQNNTRKCLGELNKAKNSSNNDSDNDKKEADKTSLVEPEEIIESLKEGIKNEAVLETKNKYREEIKLYEQKTQKIENNYREKLPYMFSDQMSFPCNKIKVQ